MPMYRYRCTQCGAHEEHLQKFSDPPLEICAACGGALAKQLTAAAFHLKGGGWYKDLYASSKPGESGGKADSAAAPSESGGKADAGKSDSGGKSDAGTSSGGSSTSTTPAASPSSTPSSGSTSSSAA